MQLCFATNNANKLKEVQGLLGKSIELLSLKDIGCVEDIPENERTIEGNSLAKARFVKENSILIALPMIRDWKLKNLTGPLGFTRQGMPGSLPITGEILISC